MSTYMQIQGMNGNVTAKGHENWIHVDSMTVGVKSPVHTKVGDTRDRIKGDPVIGDVLIVKEADASSVHLFSHSLQGKVIPTVKIDVCHTGKEMSPHQQYILNNVLVSHYEESHDPTAKNPQEMIRLNFTKIEKSHTPFDSKGNAKSPIKAGYDLEQGTIC